MFWKKVRKNKKQVLVLVLLVFGGLFWVSCAQAIDPNVNGAGASSSSAASDFFGDIASWGSGWLIKGVNVILLGIYSLVTVFLAVSMWFLDLVISPDLYNNVFFSNEAKAGISAAWSVVRDFFNLFFILIIVLVGLSVILGVGKFKDKAVLLRVAGAAMLINFSMPLTLFAIDFSQILMNFFAASLENIDVVAQLGQLINFDSILAASSGGGGFEHNIAYFMIILTAIIMITVMTVMIFYLSISLIVRLIALWVLIVLSPLAMFGFAVKGTKLGAMQGDWLKSLTSWCFYGPILLFFIWLAVVLVSVVATATASAQSAFGGTIDLGSLDAGNNLSDFFMGVAGMIVPYIVAVYLLFYGYDQAKKNSEGMASTILDKGSQRLSKWGSDARKLAYQTTLPGQREGIREGLETRAQEYDGKGKWITRRLTKKGREDIQKETSANWKSAVGGDEGKALRDYNKGKAQELLKKWKEDGVDPATLDKMFNGKEGGEAEKLAATLYKSRNNKLGFDGDGKNLYTTAMNNLTGYQDLQDRTTRESKKENLGAVIDYEISVENKDREKALGDNLKGNLKTIFENQNVDLYKQEGVISHLHEKHGDKDSISLRKMAENIKNVEVEEELHKKEEGRALLGLGG